MACVVIVVFISLVAIRGPGVQLVQAYSTCPSQCSVPPSAPTAKVAVAATVFNAAFVGQTAVHMHDPDTFTTNTTKMYACVDDASCMSARAWSQDETLRNAGFVFVDARGGPQVERHITPTARCHGWRSVHVPKSLLLFHLLNCSCDVLLIDEDYVPTNAAIKFLQRVPSADVIAPRDRLARHRGRCKDTNADISCMGLNFGRVLVRSTPHTIAMAALIVEGSRLTWDQRSFNIAVLAYELQRLVGCCASVSIPVRMLPADMRLKTERKVASARPLPNRSLAEPGLKSSLRCGSELPVPPGTYVADLSAACTRCVPQPKKYAPWFWRPSADQDGHSQQHANGDSSVTIARRLSKTRFALSHPSPDERYGWASEHYWHVIYGRGRM